MIGYPFTWERGKGSIHGVEERLDRALVSSNWRTLFKQARVLNLTASYSDHSPILLQSNPISAHTFRRRFKFENCWLKDEICANIVKDTWTHSGHLSLSGKINACSRALADSGGVFQKHCRGKIEACKRRMNALRYHADLPLFFSTLKHKKSITISFNKKRLTGSKEPNNSG